MRRYQPGTRKARRLQRECREALRGIFLENPSDVDELCQAISLKRGRPLRVEPLPEIEATNAPCGIWLEMPDSDFIFHEAAASRRHRSQIIRHELAHMLLNHRSDRTVEALAASALSEADSSQVQRALGLTAYSSVQEEEAEIAATIMVDILRHNHPGDLAPGRPGIITRLARALGPQREDAVS
ncbi:hypothetical protein [Streptomyces acidiscabies]|uniref:Secondary metabolite protein n=1 Tax=Streptomyces acidiscabies TaxID=42234 RepID=A0AAP6BLZ9_9ACTN|nr:hypothetical protein [Streptomyces acidiscabies]MBP5936742.1 secondary metabolite protein [Streptomyces sp. LBUM 1476]MBZ3915252.1 secondary metabolite protein [Streptomyces acidiscabies]MDX2967013.1 secondary metabolite protein [Streptomyces acidiscabies]MDX3021314.1 secondary metabolite protein [Streptomyces acidiscabies]MDX3793433.1 secondary metabolite protein [Streptomyces acidiscabies]